MTGPVPFGVACVSIGGGWYGPAALLQLWDIPWLLLKVPRLGAWYRAYLVRWMRERAHPYWREHEVLIVRLGQTWEDAGKVRLR